MDIRFFATFLEVSSTRHFGKAAENLYLTQAAVSARIRLLEEFFNAKLFTRHRNSISLTPAGEKLVPYAKQFIESLQLAKREVVDDGVHGLNMVASLSTHEAYLVQQVAPISQHFPQLNISLDITSTDNITRQLLEHRADVGFVNQRLKSDEIEQQLIYQCPYTLIKHSVATDADNPVADISIEQKLIEVDYGDKANDIIYRQVPNKQPSLRSASPQLALQMALSDNVQTVVPECMLNKITQQILTQSIENTEWQVLMCYRKDNPLPQLQQLGDYFKTQ